MKKLMLAVALIYIIRLLPAQETSVTYYYLEDSIRKRIYEKIGPDKVMCPRNGAGFPTLGCSYSFKSLKIVNGSLDNEEEITLWPIPERIQNVSFSIPNCASEEQTFTHIERLKEYSGYVITTENRFITTSVDVEGEVEINGRQANMSMVGTSSETATIKSRSTVTESEREFQAPVKVGKNRVLAANLRFSQSIAYQEFEGWVVLDGVVSQHYSMALSIEGKGKWFAFDDDCRLSNILTEEERTFYVTGKFGNIQATSYEIRLDDKKCGRSE